MPEISKRALATPASPIRKFLPLAQKAKEAGVKVYALSSGDPDYQVPPAFFKAIKNYKATTLNYAPSSGILEHTQAWQTYYNSLGVKIPTENIVPTSGCAEAILFALLSVTDPGDEVLVFEPVYVSYKSFAVMAGISLGPVRLYPENGYALPPLSEIEKYISPKTRAIVVINPDNPTGKLWSKKELLAVLDLAKKYNLFVIADETYREIRFSGQPECLLKYSNYKDRIILTDSVSKRFSMPGARVGCLASFNEAVMSAALRFAQARLSVGTLEQLGIVPLLKKAKAITSKARQEYSGRCDIVSAALAKMPGVTFQKPRGAFYAIAQLPVNDAEEFVKFMLTKFRHKNQTVLVAPMQDFYLTPNLGKNEIRIACVLKKPDLKIAMEILKLGLAQYQKTPSR